jgi:hypothetical protein
MTALKIAFNILTGPACKCDEKVGKNETELGIER